MFLETKLNSYVNIRMIKFFEVKEEIDESLHGGKVYKINLTLVDGSTHACQYQSSKALTTVLRRIRKVN